MCVMPLFHVHGLVATVLATLSTGGTVVLPRFRPSTFWDDAARHGVTWYTAVPTIHARLLTQAARMNGPPRHRLRFVRSCSAPLPTVLWQRYEETVGVPLVEAYGMTEAAHQMASNPLPPGERRPGTVGRATGIEIAALDDDWQPVPAGERGRGSGARPVRRRPSTSTTRLRRPPRSVTAGSAPATSERSATTATSRWWGG